MRHSWGTQSEAIISLKHLVMATRAAAPVFSESSREGLYAFVSINNIIIPRTRH